MSLQSKQPNPASNDLIRRVGSTVSLRLRGLVERGEDHIGGARKARLEEVEEAASCGSDSGIELRFVGSAEGFQVCFVKVS